jgi:hypothetical protein
MAEDQGAGSAHPERGAQEPKAGQSDTANWIAVILSATIFFFGVGSFADLNAKISGKKNIESAALRAYVSSLEGDCPQPDNPGKSISLTWLRQVLSSRAIFVNNWAALASNDKELTDSERADMDAARFQFRAANGFWSALTSDFKAGNMSAYAAHVGQYYQAMASYMSLAERYRLHKCTTEWPAPPNPSP